MAYEDLIAGRGWTNLPTPQFGGGLLSAPDVNRYQQIMSQMQQFNQPVPQGLLDASGGYNNELYDLTSQQGSAINSFNEAINQRIGGSNTAVASMAAQKAAADAAFAQLTSGEQAAMRAMEGPNLINFLTPLPVQLLMNILGASPAGTTSSGGVSSTSGSPMSGIASTGNVGQVANVTTTAQNAAKAAVAAGSGGLGTSVGTTGGVSASSGSPMGGMGSGALGASVSGAGGAGGASASSGSACCFIMLEARYGDGTMDEVVRKYRDEKITDHNKRGYYKLAEVFVPLMRQSKLFKFMVAKTFADPLVSYGKWHYGQNKHGWIFKPVERFWMKVFNTLGSDTKFIRENGETI